MLNINIAHPGTLSQRVEIVWDANKLSSTTVMPYVKMVRASILYESLADAERDLTEMQQTIIGCLEIVEAALAAKSKANAEVKP